MITIFLLSVLGAVLSRWNSGPNPIAWKPKHNVKRAVVSLALALALFVCSGGDWKAGVSGLLLFAGLHMPWSAYQDMGAVRGTTKDDLIGMTLVGGVAVGATVAIGLAWAGYPRAGYVALIPALVGPCYLAAKLWLGNVRVYAFDNWIDGHGAWGEMSRGLAVFGAAIWAVS